MNLPLPIIILSAAIAVATLAFCALGRPSRRTRTQRAAAAAACLVAFAIATCLFSRGVIWPLALGLPAAMYASAMYSWTYRTVCGARVFAVGPAEPTAVLVTEFGDTVQVPHSPKGSLAMNQLVTVDLRFSAAFGWILDAKLK